MAHSMAPSEAWLYAAQWGSYMWSGDPGACMYGFDEHFLVQSEEHRKACLAWVEDCMRDVRDTPILYERNDLQQLRRLRAALKAAPCVATH